MSTIAPRACALGGAAGGGGAPVRVLGGASGGPPLERLGGGAIGGVEVRGPPGTEGMGGRPIPICVAIWRRGFGGGGGGTEREFGGGGGAPAELGGRFVPRLEVRPSKTSRSDPLLSDIEFSCTRRDVDIGSGMPEEACFGGRPLPFWLLRAESLDDGLAAPSPKVRCM